MRFTNHPAFLWPTSSIPDFKQCMEEGFDLFDKISRMCLSLLAKGIGVSPSQFLNLLDTKPLTLHSFSNSLLTFYRYFPHQQESVAIHKVTFQ